MKIIFAAALAGLSFSTSTSTSTSAMALDCEAGLRSFTHAGGETCIPSEPLRIVSLHDLSITLPLVELGKTNSIAGSHGRIADDGTQFIRAVNSIFGVDYHNSGIEFIGVFNAIDMEKVASLEPDLIIGRSTDMDVYEQFSAIAPTVLVDLNVLDYRARIQAIADIAGEMDQYNERLAAYEARVVEAQRLIPEASDITVAVVQPWAEDGGFDLYRNMYALTEVISDIGFGQTDNVAGYVGDIEGNQVSLSGELLPDIDSDFIFTSFEVNWEDQNTPAKTAAEFEAVTPGFCDFLKACQANQIIYLPRTPYYSGSFSSLNFALDQVLTHVIGRGFTDISE